MPTDQFRDWALSGDARIEIAERRGRAVGRIVRSETGGPIRTIITGTKRRPTGVYQSVKTGYAQPYESQAELLFMKLLEADYRVSNWLAQPHRLEMFAGGETITYFPDFLVARSEGPLEVIEVKRDKSKEVRDFLAAKLQLAEQIYSLLEYRFRVLDDANLSIEPRMSNAEEIQRHAHTLYFEHELFNLLEKVSKRPDQKIPFGAAVEALGGGHVGKKKLCAMVVKREFAIDLDIPLTDETPVFLTFPSKLLGR